MDNKGYYKKYYKKHKEQEIKRSRKNYIKKRKNIYKEILFSYNYKTISALINSKKFIKLLRLYKKNEKHGDYTLDYFDLSKVNQNNKKR